jgi:hypothetical protein
MRRDQLADYLRELVAAERSRPSSPRIDASPFQASGDSGCALSHSSGRAVDRCHLARRVDDGVDRSCVLAVLAARHLGQASQLIPAIAALRTGARVTHAPPARRRTQSVSPNLRHPVWFGGVNFELLLNGAVVPGASFLKCRTTAAATE